MWRRRINQSHRPAGEREMSGRADWKKLAETLNQTKYDCLDNCQIRSSTGSSTKGFEDSKIEMETRDTSDLIKPDASASAATLERYAPLFRPHTFTAGVTRLRNRIVLAPM